MTSMSAPDWPEFQPAGKVPFFCDPVSGGACPARGRVLSLSQTCRRAGRNPRNHTSGQASMSTRLFQFTLSDFLALFFKF